MTEPTILTTDVVSKDLGVSRETVRRYCHMGLLKAVRMGRILAIDADSLRMFKREYKPERIARERGA